MECSRCRRDGRITVISKIHSICLQPLCSQAEVKEILCRWTNQSATNKSNPNERYLCFFSWIFQTWVQLVSAPSQQLIFSSQCGFLTGIFTQTITIQLQRKVQKLEGLQHCPWTLLTATWICVQKKKQGEDWSPPEQMNHINQSNKESRKQGKVIPLAGMVSMKAQSPIYTNTRERQATGMERELLSAMDFFNSDQSKSSQYTKKSHFRCTYF